MAISSENLQTSEENTRFEVFFDGECPLCKREIEMIRRKDKANSLILTDIANPEFHSTEPNMETLMKQIHGRLPNGNFVVGVEVFREIYQRIGFGRLVSASRWPVIRQLLDGFYRVFAWIRFKHAMRRIDGKFGCDDTCSTSSPVNTNAKQA